MIRRPPRSTLDRASAASDVYKRQALQSGARAEAEQGLRLSADTARRLSGQGTSSELAPPRYSSFDDLLMLSLIHISEPTRPY